ncbi:hypothetical protein ACSQ67_020888 [Phaseolus vulgaris]
MDELVVSPLYWRWFESCLVGVAPWSVNLGSSRRRMLGFESRFSSHGMVRSRIGDCLGLQGAGAMQGVHLSSIHVLG